jgi:hypothetical protein
MTMDRRQPLTANLRPSLNDPRATWLQPDKKKADPFEPA